MKAKLDPVGFLSLAVLLLGALGSAPAWAVRINMPVDSTVWMHLSSTSCLATNPTTSQEGSDCIGSNQFGPVGIPMANYSVRPLASVIAAASVDEDGMHAYLSGTGQSYGDGFLYISMVESYTVHGTATGPVDLTVHFSAEGTGYSVPLPPNNNSHLLIGAAEIKLGTWNPAVGDDSHIVLEQFRVMPFYPDATYRQGGMLPGGVRPEPYQEPFDLAIHHTQTVSVGDTFDLAYGLYLAVSGAKGTIDARNSARIAFDLPEGIYLTTARGGSYGLSEVPVPAAAWLFGSGLLGLLGLTRRR